MNPNEQFQNSTQRLLLALQQNFHEYQSRNFPVRPSEFFCLELCGEAGELANLEKKLWKGKEVPFHRVEEEAADVFIALMNYTNSRGINLAEAVFDKLKLIENKRNELAAKGENY